MGCFQMGLPMLRKKLNRQVIKLSVKTPPRGGPAADATLVMVMIKATNSGIFCFDAMWQIITNFPRVVPA